MRRYITLTIALIACLASQAITVVNDVPGQLSEKIDNPESVTVLYLNGTIDARDLHFMAEKLTNVYYFDLQNVNIAAYETAEPLFANVTQYPANEIPTATFAGNLKITDLYLPKTVTRIGEAAMAGCTALSRLTLPVDLNTLGDYTFADCPFLRNVTLPQNLTYIGQGAFLRNIRLHTIGFADLNNSPAVNIADDAFAGCTDLINVNLGNRITSIGNEAFSRTKIATDILANQTALSQIGDFAFYDTELTSANLPQSLKRVGNGAFMLNTKLASLTMPANITIIPAYLATENSALTRLDISKTQADTIAERAFYNLAALTSLHIPATTSYIGSEAMAGLNALQRLQVDASQVPDLGENVWAGVNQPAVTLTVPNAAIEAYKAAEQWKEFTFGDAFVLGDVNNDGKVDVGDLNDIINYLLGKNPQPFNLQAADITGDGKVDIGDLNGETNLILNRAMNAPALVEPNTGDVITIDDFSIQAGEQRTVEIRLDNSANYAALQCAINLPDGLTLVQGTVKQTARTETHQIALTCRDGQIRLLAYNNQANEITGNAGDAVIRLTLAADEQLPQESTIEINQVALAQNNGETRYAQPTQTLVNRTTTGVEDLTAATARVYALNQVLYIDSPAATTAQIVATNGTSSTIQLNAGTNTVTGLATGIYIVRIDQRSFKVLVK